MAEYLCYKCGRDIYPYEDVIVDDNDNMICTECSHKSTQGNNNKNNESVINDNSTITDKYNTGDRKNG